MRGHLIMPVVLVLAVGWSGPAGADPAYRAEQIIDLFASKSDSEEAETRAVCIGTEKECRQPESKPKLSQGFDLQVTFDLNSNDLTESARQNLDEFAKALQDTRLRPHAFVVEGHTDARGSNKYNMALSERRAHAVVRYLTRHGIETSKLKPKGYGKLKPRTPDPYDAANRRVETRLAD